MQLGGIIYRDFYRDGLTYVNAAAVAAVVVVFRCLLCCLPSRRSSAAIFSIHPRWFARTCAKKHREIKYESTIRCAVVTYVYVCAQHVYGCARTHEKKREGGNLTCSDEERSWKSRPPSWCSGSMNSDPVSISICTLRPVSPIVSHTARV